MKKSKAIVAALFLAVASPIAQAQGDAGRVVSCDITTAPQTPLRIEDKASAEGASVENAVLITLPNGLKAVQFSLRHTRSPDPFKTILKVRYEVDWTDDCGRQIKAGSPVLDGAALDPQRRMDLRSTAMHPDATHALLRVYVID